MHKDSFHSPALSYLLRCVCVCIYIYNCSREKSIWKMCISRPSAFMIMGLWLGDFRLSLVFCLCYSSCQCSLIKSTCPEGLQLSCSPAELLLLQRLESARVNHTSFVLLRVRFEIITSSATSKRCPRCLLMAPEVSLIFPDVLHLDRFRRECFELRLSIKKCSHIWISALLWYWFRCIDINDPYLHYRACCCMVQYMYSKKKKKFISKYTYKNI